MSDILSQIMNDDKEYLFQNYGDRLPVSFTRGENCYLFDQDGNQYIDFLSGIAVSSLGYIHPEFTKALHEQIDSLLHTSNLFYNKEQTEAAKLLSTLAFKGKTLFVNSGTEANEAAIKLARRFGQAENPDKYKIISFAKSFHGRTFGSLSATENEKIREGFGPILPGFEYLPYNNIHAFKEATANNDVCAVMVEVIQGEGGINVAEQDFLKELRSVCNDKKILLIIDEIQTGIGRTGKFFAYQHYDIMPDIITLAKGLGGGVPIGALHAQSKLADFLPKGTHGTTFGGNHLASCAAVAVLSTIKEPSFLNHVHEISTILFEKLVELKSRSQLITDVRGLGLHIGLELSEPGIDLVKRALKQKLVLNCTADKVIRIMPPLIITEEVALEGMKIFEKIIME